MPKFNINNPFVKEFLNSKTPVLEVEHYKFYLRQEINFGRGKKLLAVRPLRPAKNEYEAHSDTGIYQEIDFTVPPTHKFDENDVPVIALMEAIEKEIKEIKMVQKYPISEEDVNEALFNFEKTQPEDLTEDNIEYLRVIYSFYRDGDLLSQQHLANRAWRLLAAKNASDQMKVIKTCNEENHTPVYERIKTSKSRKFSYGLTYEKEVMGKIVDYYTLNSDNKETLIEMALEFEKTYGECWKTSQFRISRATYEDGVVSSPTLMDVRNASLP